MDEHALQTHPISTEEFVPVQTTNLKTTVGWLSTVRDGVRIIDPTGWGEQGTEDFRYKWHDELITLTEFYDRRNNSVCDFSNYKQPK